MSTPSPQTRSKVDLTFYPYVNHLVEDVFKPFFSEHGGISQSLLITPMQYSRHMAVKTIASQMPAYHKVLLNPDLEMQYHLGGYGTFYEEALIRLAGEAIERYSLMVAPYTLGETIQYATYREIERRGTVVPFEYLQPYSDEDYARLNRGQYAGVRRLEPDDVVGWVQCPSLFHPDKEIFVPAQMLFVGYRLNREKNEVAFCPGFSTGTAAHVSVERALQNALMEFIEIDALMLQWYTDLKARSVVMDDLNIATLVPEFFGSKARYEVLALDLRVLEGVEAHVCGVALMNQREERPFIVMGAQGHFDPVRALYRGMMEAAAIGFLGVYGALYMPKEYVPSASGHNYTDLDSNVALFASPENGAEKRALLEGMANGRTTLSSLKSYATQDVGADTARLLQQLSKYSEYGVYLDVTPPETQHRGWKVMRVFLPELVTMCVPGVPYSQHPRIRRYGGIRNEYPHPLP